MKKMKDGEREGERKKIVHTYSVVVRRRDGEK
jgi:hypothetical protein